MPAGLMSLGGSAVAEIVMVAGQSNAGDGSTLAAANLPVNLQVSDNRQMCWNGTTWVKMTNGVNTDILGPSGADCWGPECEFARAWLATFNRPIYIMKYAFSGSPMGPSASNSWNPAYTGGLFDTMTGYITAAKASRANSKVRVLLWMQGESDAQDPTNAANYAANLAAFITKVRTTWGDAQTRIIIGRISTYAYPYGSTVRAAQAGVVDAITKMVDTDAYGISGFHYTGTGQQSLGADMFTAYNS